MLARLTLCLIILLALLSAGGSPTADPLNVERIVAQTLSAKSTIEAIVNLAQTASASAATGTVRPPAFQTSPTLAPTVTLNTDAKPGATDPLSVELQRLINERFSHYGLHGVKKVEWARYDGIAEYYIFAVDHMNDP